MVQLGETLSRALSRFKLIWSMILATDSPVVRYSTS